MKHITRLFVFMLLCAGVAACSTTSQNTQTYQRKIYLTEQDYLEDLAENAQAERREAKPNTESEYVYRLQPETQKNVYFFDDRVRPMVPGEPSERDYKTKRLWEKPRRYSPQEYYGNQPAETNNASSADESSDFDY